MYRFDLNLRSQPYNIVGLEQTGNKGQRIGRAAGHPGNNRFGHIFPPTQFNRHPGCHGIAAADRYARCAVHHALLEVLELNNRCMHGVKPQQIIGCVEAFTIGIDL